MEGYKVEARLEPNGFAERGGEYRGVVAIPLDVPLGRNGFELPLWGTQQLDAYGVWKETRVVSEPLPYSEHLSPPVLARYSTNDM